jgi:hypothetical protein
MRALLLLSTLALGALAFACSDEGDASDAPEYRVTVRFNETVSQADQDEANEILVAYDEGVDFLIQESFPPTGVATLHSTDADVCSKITSDFEGKTYLDGVDCTVYDPPPSDNEPDEPVSDEPDEADGPGPLY